MITAAGFHLFPFRTEKLSPPAPMVLQLCGRVGRRPSINPVFKRAQGFFMRTEHSAFRVPGFRYAPCPAPCNPATLQPCHPFLVLLSPVSGLRSLPSEEEHTGAAYQNDEPCQKMDIPFMVFEPDQPESLVAQVNHGHHG